MIYKKNYETFPFVWSSNESLNKNKMNKILQTRKEVDRCTVWLKSNGLISHAFTCKDFDIANICQELKDGDLLDMGSNGSFLLPNAVKLGIKGRKCGIDLGNPEYDLEGIEYVKGDLMKTPYEDYSFDIITCLSVIEHQVDYSMLAKECNRLLRIGGKLYITFDYWEPKVDTTGIKLYDLNWNILDKSDAELLVRDLTDNGFKQTSDMDWTTKEAVINPSFCAPYGKSYSFAIMSFTKI